MCGMLVSTCTGTRMLCFSTRMSERLLWWKNLWSGCVRFVSQGAIWSICQSHVSSVFFVPGGRYECESYGSLQIGICWREKNKKALSCQGKVFHVFFWCGPFLNISCNKIENISILLQLTQGKCYNINCNKIEQISILLFCFYLLCKGNMFLFLGLWFCNIKTPSCQMEDSQLPRDIHLCIYTFIITRR